MAKGSRRDRGRNQPPVMLRTIIPPDWAAKVEAAGRLMAAAHWQIDGKPAPADRGPVRARVVEDARVALSEAPSGPMFSTAAGSGCPAPEGRDADEPLCTTAGVFRLLMTGYDWSDPVVSESFMDLILRGVDAELARPLPGAP